MPTLGGRPRPVPSSHASEREAERTADRLVPGAAVPRAGTAEPGPADAAAATRAVASGGAALPQAERAFFEPRLGWDLGHVRIHHDAAAACAARTVAADAFTAGSHIAFAAGRWAPGTTAGRRLLAHELAHVAQGVPRLARRASADDAGPVLEAVVSLAEHSITFVTASGAQSYRLEHEALPPGVFTAQVTPMPGGIDMKLPAALAPGAGGRFRWRIAPGQPDPALLLRNQRTLRLRVLEAVAVSPGPATVSPGPATTGPVPTFPIRGTRMGGATLQAWREGAMIRVKIPVHVWANPDFARERATLPVAAALQGLLLAPDAPVRVRTYQPRWFDPNLTGSNAWDEVSEAEMTAEGLLGVSARSDAAVAMNIGLTVLDALPFASRAAAAWIEAAQRTAMRGLRMGTVAGMIGMGEALPVTAGAGTRATVALVQQGADEAARQAGPRALQLTLSAAAERTVAARTTVAGAERLAIAGLRSPLGLGLGLGMAADQAGGTLGRQWLGMPVAAQVPQPGSWLTARPHPAFMPPAAGAEAAAHAPTPVALEKDTLAFAARLRGELAPEKVYKEGSGQINGTVQSNYHRIGRLLTQAGDVGSNKELLRLLPEVYRALHDRELVVEVATEVYILSRTGSAPVFSVPGMKEEIRSPFGRALVAMRQGEPINVTDQDLPNKVFFDEFAGVARSFVDLGIGSDHGKLAHLFQEIMLDRALQKLGSDGRQFRGLLAQAQGSPNQLMSMGQYIWQVLLDDMEAPSEANALSAAIRAALGGGVEMFE